MREMPYFREKWYFRLREVSETIPLITRLSQSGVMNHHQGGCRAHGIMAKNPDSRT